MNARILVLLVAALVSSQASAELVYKWADDNGRVHYSDAPPPGRSSTAVDIAVRDLTPAERKAAEDRAQRTKDKAAQVVPPGAGASAPQVAAPQPPSKQTPPGDTSACQAEWDAYLKSTECFGPYVNANGSIREEAFKVCKEVPQPRVPCRR
jgi:hypothetical protein